jgi:hypothetical protein
MNRVFRGWGWRKQMEHERQLMRLREVDHIAGCWTGGKPLGGTLILRSPGKTGRISQGSWLQNTRRAG